MTTVGGLTQRKVLRLVIILYLAQLFISVVFKNLPLPFSSNYFYIAILLVSFALFYPIDFFAKGLRYYFFFILVHFLLIISVWYQRTNITNFIVSYHPILIALLIFNHYTLRGDFETLGNICLIGMVFAAIGTVFSLFVVLRYPEALIETVGTELSGKQALASYYQRLGLLSYGFFNALSSFFPIFAYMIKKADLTIRKRNLWILFFILAFIAITRSNTTGFFLFTVIFGGGAWFVSKNIKRDLYVIVAIITFFILMPSSFTASIFYKGATYFPSSKIGLRLEDAGRTIENPYIDYYNSTEHTGKRLGRIPLLWKSFLSNPLTGGGFFTGHVAWLDMLSKFGLLGFLPWLILVWQNIKTNLKLVSNKFLPYYLLSMASFISMGFLKGTGGSHVFIFWFLLVPGIGFAYKRKGIMGDFENS